MGISLIVIRFAIFTLFIEVIFENSVILFYILQKTRENIYISEALCANSILLRFNFDILILILLMGVSSDVKAKLSGFFKTSYLLKALLSINV